MAYEPALIAAFAELARAWDAEAISTAIGTCADENNRDDKTRGIGRVTDRLKGYDTIEQKKALAKLAAKQRAERRQYYADMEANRASPEFQRASVRTHLDEMRGEASAPALQYGQVRLADNTSDTTATRKEPRTLMDETQTQDERQRQIDLLREQTPQVEPVTPTWGPPKDTLTDAERDELVPAMAKFATRQRAAEFEQAGLAYISPSTMKEAVGC